MNTSMHDEAELWAATAATGGLTEPELRAWNDHLATCPTCQKLHEEDLAMGHLIKNTLADESSDPGFEQRIIHRLQQARTSRGNRWFEVLLFHPGLSAAAAGFLLLAVAGLSALLHSTKPVPLAFSNPIDPTTLPAAVRTVMQREFSGQAVHRIQRSELNGEVSYSVNVNPRDTSKVDFVVAENGALLSINTPLEAVPPAVRSAINSQPGKLDGLERNFDNGETSYVATFLSPAGQPRDLTFNEDGGLINMEVTREEIPTAVKTTIDTQVGRGTLGGIDRIFDHGETSYVATIISPDGRSHDFTFDDDGTLSSVEVRLSELPDAAKAAIQAQAGHDRVTGIDKILDEGDPTYEASTIGADGHRHSFSLSEDGKLLSREVAINEAPDPVRQTIARVLEKGEVIEIDQTFDEPNNLVPFEIEGRKDGRLFYFLVSPTGDFLGMED